MKRQLQDHELKITGRVETLTLPVNSIVLDAIPRDSGEAATVNFLVSVPLHEKYILETAPIKYIVFPYGPMSDSKYDDAKIAEQADFEDGEIVYINTVDLDLYRTYVVFTVMDYTSVNETLTDVFSDAMKDTLENLINPHEDLETKIKTKELLLC